MSNQFYYHFIITKSKPVPITFTLNGAPTTVDAPEDMPLLWVLRDMLDMKGTKFGCGVSQCGACTVHLNGRATRSCQVRVGTIDGDDVTTIEGLSPDGSHPLQQAWRDLDVPQCGYCQAGQLMAAAEFSRPRSLRSTTSIAPGRAVG